MHTPFTTLRHPGELDLGSGYPAAARSTLPVMSKPASNPVAKPISTVALAGLQKTTEQACTRYAAIRCAEIVNLHPTITTRNMLEILRREAAAAAVK